MKKNIIIIFFYIFLIESSKAELKEKIILNLKKTNNLTFNFKQKINDKSEIGYCAIEYPKKIFCSYNNLNKKIMVSNGKSLVIKNKNINQYYVYPLKKTPLEYLLNKDYLISKMKILEPREVGDKYLNFKFFENNNELNIFFDKENLNLVGWQTEDIYQNLSITFISSIKRNQKIDKRKFVLPQNK